MGKWKKLWDATAALIKKPYLLNAVLQTDEFWLFKIRKDFPDFQHGLPQIPLQSILTENGSTLAPISFLGGGSMVTDIALLKSLASKISNCSYFEIGTWRGESVANVSAVAQECVTLNLGADEMRSLGWSEDYIELHGYYSKNLPNVTHVHGDSKTYDFAGLKKTFDLIFIDGDHHHEYVVNDTQQVQKHLMHGETVIVWHDYAYSPEQFRPEVLHGILSAISTSNRGRLFHVGNTLSAIYLPLSWPISSTPAINALVNPKQSFSVNIHPLSAE